MNELKAIYDELLNKVSDPKLKEKQFELQETVKSINNFEKSGFKVPEYLRQRKRELLLELEETEKAQDLLNTFESSIKTLIPLFQYKVDKKIISKKRPINVKGVGRTKDFTKSKDFTDKIIEALRYFNGTAKASEVCDYIYNKYKHTFKPGDYELRKYGQIFWVNNVQWCRANLVREGILKKNSPFGIWELEDEYK